MTQLVARQFDAAGVTTRALTAGPERQPAILFLQSAVPGVSPYCGGAHVWGEIPAQFAGRYRVVALDGLGSGGTGLGDGVPTIEAMARHVVAAIEALKTGPVHLVAHDVAGMVALWLAMERPGLLASITVVASAWAAPSGDGVENYALRHPPAPLWSRESQGWTFDRLSYSHHHIDATLLDAATAAAAGDGHRAAIAAMAGDGYARGFLGSAARTKSLFFRTAREKGLGLPTQVVWGHRDPLSSVDYGLWLFRIVAGRQRAAQFHVINRAGSFPFREQPDEFRHVVGAFVDGLQVKAA